MAEEEKPKRTCNRGGPIADNSGEHAWMELDLEDTVKLGLDPKKNSGAEVVAAAREAAGLRARTRTSSGAKVRATKVVGVEFTNAQMMNAIAEVGEANPELLKAVAAHLKKVQKAKSA